MVNIRLPKPRYTPTWVVHRKTKYLNRLPWKYQVTALEAPLNQIGNACSPFLSPTSFVPCKDGPLTLLCGFGRSCLYTRVSEKVRLSRTTTAKKLEVATSSFFASSPHNARLCPVGTLRHYFTATRNLRPVFPSSKPDVFYQPIFKANFCYIRSSHSQPLLCALRVRAFGCTWSFLAVRVCVI